MVATVLSLQPECDTQKTKICVWTPTPHNAILQGQVVETVASSKCLGTVIDDELSFEWNTDKLWKKGKEGPATPSKDPGRPV